MSLDIQFISLVDNLQVVEISDVDGAVPRAVRIVGVRGFTSARRVEIGGVGIDSFVVISDQVILADVPDALLDVEATSMTALVVAGKLTSGRRATLVFAPTSQTRSVGGIQKLVQQVVKEFLSSAGSDRFDPAKGGDALSAVGAVLDPSGQSRIAASLAAAASRVQDLFLARQARDTRLLPSERLLSFSVGNLSFGLDMVTVTLGLVSQDGRSIEVPFLL